MTIEEFKEKIFELAFGDDAINRDFSLREVVERIEEMVMHDDISCSVCGCTEYLCGHNKRDNYV